MDIQNILSIGLILFSVIDIVGNIPVIIDLKNKGVVVDSLQAALVSLGLMIAFLFVCLNMVFERKLHVVSLILLGISFFNDIIQEKRLECKGRYTYITMLSVGYDVFCV